MSASLPSSAWVNETTYTHGPNKRSAQTTACTMRYINAYGDVNHEFGGLFEHLSNLSIVDSYTTNVVPSIKQQPPRTYSPKEPFSLQGQDPYSYLCL